MYEELMEKQISTETIYKGRILTLNNDVVVLPDNRQAQREVIRHNGAVCVVPITEENEVITVFQCRYPFNEVLCEVPAGKLDSKNENPLDAAKRELKEETGAIADSITYIGDYYPSPAILDEVIHMYVARGLKFEEQHLDSDEFLYVKRIPLDELCNKIISGEIKDGKTQAAVLKVKLMMK